MNKEKVLSIRDLSISFQTTAGEANAIRGVKLDLYKGETLAIVGESGSGKSVTVKAIMGILSGMVRLPAAPLILPMKETGRPSIRIY